MNKDLAFMEWVVDNFTPEQWEEMPNITKQTLRSAWDHGYNTGEDVGYKNGCKDTYNTHSIM